MFHCKLYKISSIFLLKQVFRSRTSRSICTTTIVKYPRQAKIRGNILDTDPVPLNVESFGKKDDSVAQSNQLEDGDLSKTPSDRMDEDSSGEKPHKNINPIIKKYEDMLRKMTNEADEYGTEYVFSTNFGSIRFDDDNLAQSIGEDAGDVANLQKDNSSDGIEPFINDSNELIDRQFFGDALDRDVKTETQVNNTEDILVQTNNKQDINEDKDLNYIDEVFFKDENKYALASDIKEEKQMNKVAVHDTSKQDIDEDKDLNYIDEIFFKDEKNSNNSNELSECKSDFERALLDIDDETCHFSTDPAYKMGPHTAKLEDSIKESYKEEMATFAVKGFTEHSPEKHSEQREFSSQKLHDNTINVSVSKEKLYHPHEIKNQNIPENSAFAYALELRRKEKLSKLGEKTEEGNVPRYKQIINSVWRMGNRPDYEVQKLLRNSLLYNQHDIVAIFKPYGLKMHGGGDVAEPGGTMVDLLPQLCSIVKADKLHPIHRLDMNTTGVLLFAKSEGMSSTLRGMLKEREMIKTYLTITKGLPGIKQGLIDIPLREGSVESKKRMVLRPIREGMRQRDHTGSRAVTKYKVLSHCHDTALLAVEPLTGVKHQIRVHLGLALSCPVLADHKYSSHSKLVPQKLPGATLERLQIKQSRVRDLPMFLHASSVFLPQIIDGRNIKISCPPPPHFTKALKALKLNCSKNVENMKNLETVDIGVNLV